MGGSSSLQRHQYGMWLQYSGRTNNFFCSPSTSPLGQNKIMIDLQTRENSPQSTNMGAIAQKSVVDSQKHDSDSKPMDISPAFDEAVTFSLPAAIQGSNDGNQGGINADLSTVKKKLEFDVVTKVPSKGQVTKTQSMDFIPLTIHADDKPKDVMKGADLNATFGPMGNGLTADSKSSNGSGMYSLRARLV